MGMYTYLAYQIYIISLLESYQLSRFELYLSGSSEYICMNILFLEMLLVNLLCFQDICCAVFLSGRDADFEN